MARGAAPYIIGLLLVAWELTLFHPASWCFGEAMSLLWMWCEWRWMAMVSLAGAKGWTFNIPRLSGCCSDLLVVTWLVRDSWDSYISQQGYIWTNQHNKMGRDRYLSWLDCCFWFHRFVMSHPLLVGFGSSMCCLWTHHTYRWHQQFGSGIGCGPVEHCWKLPLLQVRVFRIISWWFHRCLPWNHRVAPTQSSQLKDSHWWKIGWPCDLPNLNIWNPQKVGDIPSSSADSMEVKVGISPKWVINDDKCLSKCVPIPFTNCDSMNPRFILG